MKPRVQRLHALILTASLLMGLVPYDGLASVALAADEAALGVSEQDATATGESIAAASSATENVSSEEDAASQETEEAAEENNTAAEGIESSSDDQLDEAVEADVQERTDDVPADDAALLADGLEAQADEDPELQEMADKSSNKVTQTNKKASVAEGAYELLFASTSKAVGIKGNAYEKVSALVQLGASKHIVSQRWYVQKTGKHYVLINAVSGLALDMGGKDTKTGTQLKLAKYTGAVSQQWDFYLTEEDTYEITSVANGLALEARGGSAKSGTAVQVADLSHKAAQTWQLKACAATVDDGIYTIGAAGDTDLVLHVRSTSRANGKSVMLYTANGGLAQQYQITYDSQTGYYRIQAACSGKYLQPAKARAKVGVTLVQAKPSSSTTQLWNILYDEASGTYCLRNATASVSVDVANGTLARRAAAQLGKSSKGKNQGWVLTRTSLIADGLYQVTSMLKKSLVVQVKGASLKVKAKLQLSSKSNGFEQKWQVAQLSDGTYTLMNANSGRYLADKGGKIRAYKKVSRLSCWNAKVSPYGGVQLVNVGTGRALCVKGDKAKEKAAVTLAAPSELGGQSWSFKATTPLADGMYYFQSLANTNRVVTVNNGSKAEGAKLRLQDIASDNAQKWQVKRGADGWYTIVNVNSGLTMSVTTTTAKAGTTISQRKADNSDAQKWQIGVAPCGGLVLTTKMGNFVMGCKGGSSEVSTAMVLSKPGTLLTTAWYAKATSESSEEAEDTSVPDVATDSDAYVTPTGVTMSPSYREKIVARANAAKNASFNSKAWASLTEEQKKKAKQTGSGTNWYITVDKGDSGRLNTIVCVLHRNNGEWEIVRSFVAVTKSTFTGHFVILHKQEAYWLPGHRYYGASYTRKQVRGINPFWCCYVHDMGYDDGTGKVEAGQGFHGGDSSGGCIVLPNGTATDGGRFGEAEYIYLNVPVGSTVDLFD